MKPVSVAARQSRQTAITPRVPSLGLFWHAVEFCAKGSPGFTGLTMWKGALFNVTYARNKPVQIFFLSRAPAPRCSCSAVAMHLQPLSSVVQG